MTSWADIDRELDAWGEAGSSATLWWRDDDAGAAVDPLRRLVALAGDTGVPLALAVIPERLEDSLPDAVVGPEIAVFQHGSGHRNHAAPAAKKAELGDDRSVAEVCEELARGWSALRGAFGATARPVIVPPWNRIGGQVARALPGRDYSGLSTFGARSTAEPVSGLRQVNTHIDIVDWRGSRGFIGEPAALAALARHLTDRRQGRADAAEATGLLTHHLDHDAGCWRFLEALFARTIAHSAARWLDADALFPAVSER